MNADEDSAQKTKGKRKMARVIAIDGPSGSGKSSTSKRVGAALGFLHVDSGALYRIMHTTWAASRRASVSARQR